MIIRAILILALLTQQLVVWPCLSLCRMLGGCVSTAPCADGSSCATACETACATICATIGATAGTTSGEEACACGPLGHLACASAALPPEQGQPPAPAAPPLDLIVLLALPVAFVPPMHHDRPEVPSADPDRAGSASFTAGQARAMLCCWVI